jgi:hypothetical protein
MPPDDSPETRRPRSRTQLRLALALTPAGALLWFLGMYIAFTGDSSNPAPDWLMWVAMFLAPAGFLIGAAGAVWLLLLLVSRALGEGSSPSESGGGQ